MRSKIVERIGLLRSIGMYYWKPGNYRRLKKFYRQFISPGDLCFDVGAHIGNRTHAWNGLGARTIAIEPQPACIRYLQRRFGKNPNVHIVEKAVGPESGTADLHISRLTPTISTLSTIEWRAQINSDAWYEVTWPEEVTVEVTTLDTLINEFGVPNFCKLDVENYELEALQGLAQPIPQLSIEYYPPVIQRTLACIDLLEELAGYEYNWSFGETQRLNAEKWIDASAIKRVLTGYSEKKDYGDLYARFNSPFPPLRPFHSHSPTSTE